MSQKAPSYKKAPSYICPDGGSCIFIYPDNAVNNIEQFLIITLIAYCTVVNTDDL